MLRQVHHGPTRAYTSRRVAQGKSQREIRRCLKRTLARQLYRLLERTATKGLRPEDGLPLHGRRGRGGEAAFCGRPVTKHPARRVCG
jgi:hypothetical protein